MAFVSAVLRIEYAAVEALSFARIAWLLEEATHVERARGAMGMEFAVPGMMFGGVGPAPIGKTRTERIGNVERKTTRIC